VKLYDAPRCPFCARVRIALAEKGLAYETVVIDLSNRPAFLYELNPVGKVPVLDDDGFILPESDVIMEYLDDRFPEAPLLPPDPRERAAARLAVYRFDDLLGDQYYAFRRGEPNRLPQQLAALELGRSLFVDIAYAPWVIRARDMLGLELPAHIDEALAPLASRPAFAAEVETVRSL
jgi:stringent starvation protein A